MPYSEDQPTERNVNTEGGDYSEEGMDKRQGIFITDNRQGVFWERVRIPLAVIGLVLVIVVATSIISAGASLEGFRRQLQSVGVLAPDPTAVPTVEPLLFTPERAGETLIVIAPFFRPDGVPDHDIHNEIKMAIRQAATDVDLPNLRVEVVEGNALRADDRAGAESLAKKYNASIVIWGADTGVRVTVNYLNLRQPDFDAAAVKINETDRTQLANPSAYASFVVEDLPHQLSFLALFAVGQSAYVRGAYSDATRIIERAVAELDKTVTPPEGSADAYFRLGWLYQKPGNDAERAIGMYDEAITLDPRYVDAYINRGNARANPNDAIADYNQAIALNPQYAEAYNNRGVARSDQNDLDGAIADYDQAIALNPQLTEAYVNRGVARRTQNDLDGAIADYDQAIKLNPQLAETYNNRGNARADQGNPNDAIADYNQAIALNPQYAKAYNNRGAARHTQNDFDGATADYNQAIALNPQLVEAYINRGNARKDQNDLDGAKADYNQAIVLNPQLAEAYIGRGIIRSAQNDFDGAIADYNQAIALNPQDAKVYYNRGLVRVYQGDLDGAIADFEQAIKLNPQDAEAYNNRGIAHAYQGDLDGAIADFEQAIKLNPQDAKVYYNCGTARRTQGNFDGAIADFKKVLTLSNDPSVRQAAEQALKEMGVKDETVPPIYPVYPIPSASIPPLLPRSAAPPEV